MRKILCLVFYAALAMPGTSWTNGAPIYHPGIDATDVIPIKNQHIRMVKETVDIDCKWENYTVHVKFWYKNTTDQKQELFMGFPVDAPGWEESESSNTFRVRWNGKPLEHSRGRSTDVSRQWFYWKAKFGPYEEATNEVSYTFPCHYSSEGDKGDDEPYVWLSYILKTGAAWAGPIESSVVTVDFNHVLPDIGSYRKDKNAPGDNQSLPSLQNLTMYPPGYTVDEEKRVVTWEFKNFVPNKNIYFGWGYVPDFVEVDKHESIEIEDPTSAPVKQKIFGKVTLDGKPSAIASVWLGYSWSRDAQATTDEQGMYSFEDYLRRQQHFEVHIPRGRKDGGELYHSQTVNVADQDRVDFALRTPNYVTAEIIAPYDPLPGKWSARAHLKAKQLNSVPGYDLDEEDSCDYELAPGQSAKFEGLFKGSYDLVLSPCYGYIPITIPNLQIDNLKGDQDLGKIECPPLAMLRVNVTSNEDHSAEVNVKVVPWGSPESADRTGRVSLDSGNDNWIGPLAVGNAPAEYAVTLTGRWVDCIPETSKVTLTPGQITEMDVNVIWPDDF